jgi:serine/threonine-protein kinase HipA
VKALRKADVMFKETMAGVVEETGAGYRFSYDPDFLKNGAPIAVAFPLRAEPYESRTLFPFFKGLLPEGWYREVVCQTLKIDPKDDFGLLVKACGDTIGAVWIKS